MLRSRVVGIVGFAGVAFGVACSGSSNLPPPAEIQGNTQQTGDSGIAGDGSTTTNPSAPPNCYPDDVSGVPRCSWKEISNNASKTITAKLDVGGGNETVQLELTGVVPTVKVASAEECKALRPGFLLKGTDIDETLQPNEGVYWFLVTADGKWRSAGNGGVSGLVAAFDPAEPDFDGGVPRVPTYEFSNHCDDLFKDPGDVALATVMTVIHSIHVGKAQYEADFVAQNDEDSAKPSGHYFLIVK